jgi:hypothetical protein
VLQRNICASLPIVRQRKAAVVLLSLFLITGALHAQAPADPLPSWNDGPLKKSIIDFVTHTTTAGDAAFVPPEERILVSDNDGTLWTEQPLYTEFLFTLDRVKTLAPQHPEWKTEQPYATVLSGDPKAIGSLSESDLMKLVVVTHVGMTVDQFDQMVSEWIPHAQSPRFHRLYTECVYQPMLELLRYFRANGYKTYIASGGEVEFMRPWTEKTYGIPPEQVIGTMFKMKLEVQNGAPVLMRLPEIDLVDDGPGKPVGIGKFIGRKPVVALGNSDGDQQMLEWTAAAPGPHLMLLVHHTDAAREAAYDRNSSIGRLDKALDEAIAKHWLVVDMKNDWRVVFPPQ